MTRKHYVALANALYEARPKASADAYCQWLQDTTVIADTLAQLNPNFDRARFIAACEKGSAK